MATLAEISKRNTTAKGINSSLPSPIEDEKDFGEGLAYLGEKTAVGFVSSVEGIWDFAASGIAKLFGADEWAEEQIANDWFGDWYSHPDEWFQPTGGWKIAGDVASGIGTSLPAMAAVGVGVGIAAASGGTLAPAAIGLISAGVAGLGAAGRGVKEAYDQTGQLGGKEYLYGAGTGIVEGGIEGVMNAIGLGGVGSVFKNFGKSATKSMASRVGVAVVDGFLGEAFEEGLSEFVTPYIKKFTYDPNAKNATLQEIGYAALVGGLSGALMGGGGAAVDVSSSLISGTKAINDGRTAEITEYGKIASAFEDAQKTKDEYYERVASSYKALSESLEKTGGEIKTANQRMMLGDLAKAEVRAKVAPMLYKEAANILNDVDGFVARFNGNEYTDLNGKPITLTVEQLTKGFDRSNPESIREAIKTNDTLRTVSAMAAAGKLMSNTSAMADNVLKGNKLKSEVELAQFAEKASTEEIEALSRELEIDDWSSLSLNDFNERLDAYRERGGVEKYAERQKLVNKMKKIKQGKSVPKGVAGLKDGQVTRYSDGTLDVGVANVGGSYLLYDFNSGNESRLLTHDEINTYFREYSQEQYKAEQTKREEANAKRKAEVEELDTWARENIPDYATLAASAKTMIRKVIRQARANGLSESDVKMWADMSAHSGLDVTFDKKLSQIKIKVKQKDGTVKEEIKFANAYYDEKRNRIVVNPEARISQEKALFHELDHALRAFYKKKGINISLKYKKALDNVDEDTEAQIKKEYGDDQAVIVDETTAFYAAEIMATKGYAKALATEQPSVMKRILSFFKEASNYKNERLSRAAKSYYKLYQKMYEEFSAANRGNNAIGGVEGSKRYALPLGDTTVDARTVTEQEVRILLKNAFSKQYRDGSYIPVRVNTPSILIEAAHGIGKTIDDLPIILNVGKARQMMSSQREWALEHKTGTAHEFTEDDVIALIKAMNKPKQIIYQSADERYVEVVEFETAKKQKAVAVLEIGENKNPEYLNGYNGGFYQILVTAFEPDTGYVESLLKKNGNIQIYPQKKKGSSQRGSGNKVPSHLNESPFANSIPQTPEKSTPSAKKDEATLPEGARAALQIEYDDYDKPITSKDRSNLRTIEKKSINKFTHDDLVKTRKWAYRYYKDKNIGVKSPFFRAWFGEWRAYDKKTAAETIDIPQGVKIDTSNRKITNKDTKWQIQITEDTIQDSLHYAQKDRLYIQRILSHIDEIIEKAVFLDTQISSKNKSNKKGSSEFMHYLYAIVEFQGAPFLAKITVEEYDAGTSHRAYNAQRIKMSALSRAQYSQLKTAYRGKYASSVDAISIADLINLVNTYDDKFTPAPEISPEAAKLLLNKDGTPKVFYHGTRKENGEFWEFDYNKANKKGGLGFKSLGAGNYFTSNKLDGTELYGSRVIDAYLSIKKPLVVKHGSDFKNEVSRAININALQMTYPRIQQEMRAAGYDGVVLLNENSEVAIAVTFDSEQIKSATDNIGTFDGSNPDIRYSLDISQNNGKKFALPDGFNTKAIKAKGVPTTTERPANISQIVANNTRNKVYSRGAALSVVNQLSGIKGLTLGERDELVSAVWKGFNECETREQKRTFSREMAEYITAKLLEDAKKENSVAHEASERLKPLRTGVGKISFTETELADIEQMYHKDGLKKIKARWEKKNRNNTVSVSYPLTVFVSDIASNVPGMEHLAQTDPVSALIEIDALYEDLRGKAKDKWLPLFESLSDDEISGMIDSIELTLLNAFETEGDKSTFARLVENKIETYENRAAYYKAEHDNIKGRDKLLGLLVHQAQRMKELKLGVFANMTQHKSEIFKGSIESLSKIQFRGNLNVTGTRKIIADLKEWYTSDNLILQYVDENSPGYYDKGVAEMLSTLATDEKGFTKDDLKMLINVMSYFINLVETYNKVWRNGKWVDAKPECERYIKLIEDNENLKVGMFWKRGGSMYTEMFGDPMTVARRMDMYGRGFFTESLEDLRAAAEEADVAEMEVKADYDEFMRMHKKYLENAAKETVFYRDVEIPKLHLIGLYMTMNRKHAHSGLAYSGFTFHYNKKEVRVRGFVDPEAKLTEAQLEAEIKKQQAEIERHLSAADKEYIAILEKGYNEDVRKLKVDRDMQRLGFTNATNTYYYPIRRADRASNIDMNDIGQEIDRVSNSSFNKDIVQGAKQKLFIESADVLFNRHVHAVCQYSCLSPAIETFNRLFNMDISGNPNDPVSVRTASKNTWMQAQQYFRKLISDIQGIPAVSNEASAVLGTIRSGYAKYQLGANPKVWLTQLSSIFAATSMLDADSISKGMTLPSKDVDDYCALAKLRNYDNTAAIAQGNLESRAKRVTRKIDSFSDVLMSPIGKVDRFVVGRLFGACQAQIEKNGGAKIGTEENKVAAGKLLRNVLFETQQNSIATEKSRAMRSGSEFMRMITMFTSDSMKVIGRVIDSVGEVSVLKAKIKATKDAKVIAVLDKQLKNAEKKARKSIGALIFTAVFMAGIAQLFRWLYDKERDEDETVIETMTVDAVGNLFGGLPIVKDVISFMVDGYELDNYAYSTLNDLLDSAKDVFEIAGAIIMQEELNQTIPASVRKMSYAVGQILGVPTRNIYNVLYGLTKRFSPTTAYRIDNVFYEKNYKSDLYKAVEEGDGEMVGMLMSMLYNERMSDSMSESVHSELYRLSMNGYKVMPKAVPSKITYNGEEVELTATEQNAIQSVYSSAQASLEKLFANAKYTSLSDEQKESAIDYVYDLHYDRALESALGIDRGNNVLLSNILGVDILALLAIATKGLDSDKDDDGKTISGTKRKKIIAAIKSLGLSTEQQLLLICAKGYSIKDGDVRGLTAGAAKKRLLRYILNLKNTSKEEKAELAKLCGFQVSGGKIIQKSVV